MIHFGKVGLLDFCKKMVGANRFKTSANRQKDIGG